MFRTASVVKDEYAPEGRCNVYGKFMESLWGVYEEFMGESKPIYTCWYQVFLVFHADVCIQDQSAIRHSESNH